VLTHLPFAKTRTFFTVSDQRRARRFPAVDQYGERHRAEARA